MATSKKKTSGISLQSTDTDPLRAELDEIFKEFPDGATIAYGFLTTETSCPFCQISDQENVWRVRRDAVDVYINGIRDRVELKWTKSNNNQSAEP